MCFQEPCRLIHVQHLNPPRKFEVFLKVSAAYLPEKQINTYFHVNLSLTYFFISSNQSQSHKEGPGFKVVDTRKRKRSYLNNETRYHLTNNLRFYCSVQGSLHHKPFEARILNEIFLSVNMSKHEKNL